MMPDASFGPVFSQPKQHAWRHLGPFFIAGFHFPSTIPIICKSHPKCTIKHKLVENKRKRKKKHLPRAQNDTTGTFY